MERSACLKPESHPLIYAVAHGRHALLYERWFSLDHLSHGDQTTVSGYSRNENPCAGVIMQPAILDDEEQGPAVPAIVMGNAGRRAA